MVVRKEFAVLFKRNKKDEYIDEFIPYTVVEGRYHEYDDWFIDLNDMTYTHIAQPTVSGIGYGSRAVIEKEEEFFTEEKVEKLKEDILDYAKLFTYERNSKHTYYIVSKRIDGSEETLYEDMDTDELYELHEKYSEEEPDEEYNDKITMKPAEICNQVKATIKGQDKAVETIVTSLWITKNFKNLTKRNMLVIGPTGVGKTAIFQKLEKILGIPVTVFPVAGLSQAGYVGRGTEEILKQVFYDSGEDIVKAENSIVILDEIDKLAYGEGKSADVSTSGVQNELLKIIEGCKMLVRLGEFEGEIELDTSNIIFVGAGAFSELYKKQKKTPVVGFGADNSIKEESIKINSETLEKYGLKREFIGRLPVVVELNAMTKDIIKEIILTSDESEYLNTIKAIESLDVKVTNADDLVELIAEDAINKGIGARGLVRTVNMITSRIFYEIANAPGKYKAVTIGKNILNDETDFELIPKRVKRKTKTPQTSKVKGKV